MQVVAYATTGPHAAFCEKIYAKSPSDKQTAPSRKTAWGGYALSCE